MSQAIKATVLGVPELAAKLKQIASAARGKMLANAALAGASEVEVAAKQLVPKKTRSLGRSIHSEVTKSTDDYAEVAIGTDLEYAAIQEFGGTITPKNSRYLAIPLTDSAEQYGSPRSYPGSLKPRMRGGHGVLVDESGTAVYALVKRVTIPAHPYLRPALDNNEARAREQMAAALSVQIAARAR
jgi:HK97 gp10 family phage protein